MLGPTTVVAIHPDSGGIKAKWLDPTTLTATTEWAERLNATGYNLYFCPNEPRRRTSKKPRKADIEGIRAVYADVDAKDGRTSEQAWGAILALPAPPSLTIMTGGGFQPVWLLKEPVPASAETALQAEAISGRIAELSLGDPVGNIDRILRVPFTLNFPTAKKRAAGRTPCPAGLVVLSVAPQYTLEELAAIYLPRMGEVRVIPFPGQGPGQIPEVFTGRQWPNMNAAAQAGLSDGHWFDKLAAEQKNGLLCAILIDPRIVALADVPREPWLQLLFALADAYQRGATEARELAQAWSATSTRFDANAFDRDWRSFKPRPGGITIATLLHTAEKAGLDLAPWRAATNAATTVVQQTGTGATFPIVANTGAGANPGDAFPITQGAPFSTMPCHMTAPVAEAHLNARLFKATDWGGAPAFGRLNQDGSIGYVKPRDLPVLLAGHFVEVPDGKGGTKDIPAAVWWTQSPSKIAFDRVLFDPEGTRALPGESVLNTWRGFATQPAKGGWGIMRRHLWGVICGQNRTAFKYLVRWLAHAVQYPGTNPEVMVVLRSNFEGVGKSSVGQWMLRMFGRHGLEVADTKQVFGEFNADLDNRSFVLIEEAMFPGDRQSAEVVKATITAKTLRINPKGRPAYEIPHGLHFMMCTNGQWAVPAGAGARRFLVLDVKTTMPRGYFDALWAEAEAGGIAAMLHDLLRLDLSKFNPREVPATAALIAQQRRSADDVTQWITDAVAEGCLIPNTPNRGFGAAYPSSVLRAHYIAWTNEQGIRRPKTAVAFGRALSEMGLARSASNNPSMWTIPDRGALLAASDRRAGIRQISR